MSAVARKSPAKRVKRARNIARRPSRIELAIQRAVAPLKKEIKALRADLDAIEDDATLRILATAPDEERFPAAVARRLVAGENAVKVFREHRGLTQAALAEAAGSSAAYVSQIERGDREAGKNLIPKLAAALHVDAEDLR